MELKKKTPNTKWTTKGIIAFILLLMSIFGFSQNDLAKLRFKHLSIEDGLSEVAVWCIAQDRRGFMWFGTQDGLNRYDGYRFKVYKNETGNKKSLSDNFVLCIREDREGFLWIGTKAGGLNRFDPYTEEFTRFPLESSNKNRLNDIEVKVIHEDKNKTIWVGTEGAGLWGMVNGSKTFSKYENIPANFGNDINTIFEDRKGVTWIGTKTGLYYKDGKNDRFTLYIAKGKIDSILPGKSVTAIAEEDDGSFWVGTRSDGLFKLDRQTGNYEWYQKDRPEPFKMTGNDIMCLYYDRNKILWVGSEGGLSRKDKLSRKFYHYKHELGDSFSLGDGEIFSIFESNDGLTWIGGYGDGVSIYDPDFNCFQLYRNESGKADGLSENSIWAILEDQKGVLWIGTYREGLNRLDRRNKDTNKRLLDGKDIRCLLEDRKRGLLWVGTKREGLIAFDLANEKEIHWKELENAELKKQEVTVLYTGRSGDLWIGTREGGLYCFNRDKKTFSHHFIYDDLNPGSLSYNFVRDIIEDKDGTLWVGTEGGGLNRLVPGKNEFVHYLHDEKNPKSLGNNRIKTIYEDKKGRLWIGTDGGGLAEMQDLEKGVFKLYKQKDGLANNTVYGILEDEEGALWLSTNKGLTKFDPEKKTFRNYDEGDGLQSNEFNTGAYFKSEKTGEMFFGGDKGFNAFFPNDLRPDTGKPEITITDFFINNNDKSQLLQWKEAENGEPRIESIERTLTYKDNIISFEFAALRCANPGKNKYKYQLEGYDTDWIETDGENRRATYMNLPSGQYTFRVRGSNKDGVWNYQGVAVNLKVLPPPWETFWAYTLYVMAGGVIIFLSWSTWKKRILQQKAEELVRANKELEKKHQELKETQEQLIQSEKMSSLGMLLANLAHEINNPAATILLNSEFFVKEWPNIIAILDEYYETHQNITLAGIPYEEAKEEINKLITGLNHSAIHIQDLVKELKNFSRKTDAEERNPIDINKVIHSAIQLTQNKIKKATQNFQFKEGEGLPEILGNASRLTQVFINLIQNACEALPDESKGIYIETAFDKMTNIIIIQVKDEGIGIEKKNLRYITDPFFTTKRNSGGTGLGLAISNKIIQEHSGQMHFESPPGKGTTVFVYIPLFTSEYEDRLQRMHVEAVSTLR